MEYLNKEDIILINRKTVERHGGSYLPPLNFLNEGPLNYLLEVVKGEISGQPLYPAIYDKAGLYMYNIICNHVFRDGNKRTGLGSALLFLRLNNYQLKKGISKIKTNDDIQIPLNGNSDTEILIEFTLEVASGKIKLAECQE